MTIKVFNTLKGEKEQLLPNVPGKIGMYVCGPTVYNYIHIGNARTFLNFDLIRRYLIWRGFEVTFVQNITDVDDKIINRARDEGTTPDNIAEKYTAAFQEQMAELGLLAPTIAPKATETIAEMIKLVEELQQRGLAYETEDGIYFPVRRFGEYGKLSKRSLEEMRAGERIKVDENKEDPMDFALWKRAKPGEPHWPSPWGEGRPGWHLECSAMSLKYLGMGFDIHGGARDLIFPHHENEIAQSEGATGAKPFVHYWLHGGLLNIDQEKMSKSLGNFTLLTDVLQGWGADVIRMFMLGTHYRNPLDFSEAGLKEASAKLQRIEIALTNIDFALATTMPDDTDKTKLLRQSLVTAQHDFVAAMDDDFNSAAALSAIFNLIKDVNKLIEVSKELPNKRELEAAKDLIVELNRVLGLVLSVETKTEVSDSAARQLAVDLDLDVSGLSTEIILDSLLKRREQARTDKDWQLADKIRDGLGQIGVEIEDTQRGTRWKIVTSKRV